MPKTAAKARRAGTGRLKAALSGKSSENGFPLLRFITPQPTHEVQTARSGKPRG